jgi:hypothetical protein
MENDTMTPLQAAITIKEDVKGRITHYKSANKSLPNPERYGTAMTPQQVSDRQLANKAVDVMVNQLRKNHNNPQSEANRSLKNIVYYGALALGVGYGNCLEVSCAVAWHLNEMLALGEVHFFNFDLVFYPKADHVFVVLNQASDQNGDYPTSFATWSADAIICDVWADIACPAREYPDRWRARMRNWSVLGTILSGNVDPTTWSNVVELPKKSFLHS